MKNPPKDDVTELSHTNYASHWLPQSLQLPVYASFWSMTYVYLFFLFKYNIHLDQIILEGKKLTS